MRSPFPGMDPYLESRWHSVHTTLNVFIAEALNRVLPSDLRADVEESLRVESQWPQYRRTIYPDVGVNERPVAGGDRSPDPIGTAVAAEPMRVEYRSDPSRWRHVVITDARDGERLVTAIELLSPDVKRRGDARRSYVRKLREYFHGGINIVEVNLLRRGRMPLELDAIDAAGRPMPYSIYAHRATDRRAADVYAFTLREPIPAVRVPLRPRDADVVLDLQPLLDRAYTNGRYPIDYARPADPPLSPDDAGWLAGLLAART